MLLRIRQDLLVAIAVLIVFVAMLLWSAAIPHPRGREFPVLVSTAAVVLCMLDVLSHTDTRIGLALRLFLSGAAQPSALSGHGVRLESIATAWIVGASALMVVAGFLVAIPVYVLGYMLLYARRTVRQAAIAAVATTVCIWAGFELLLSYELYRGVLAAG